MKDLWSAVVAIVLLGFSGCTGSPTRDIVRDSFPEAEAAIRAEMLALNDIDND